MRIAQIAPLAESVPPKLYGGTERVVAWLVDELVGLDHEVTLFASGDSRTRAELHAVWPRALRLGRPRTDPNVACAVLREAVAQRAAEFDVIHAHIDWLHVPVLTRLGVPFLTTLHGRLDLPGVPEVIRQFPSACFVSISDRQRTPLKTANWCGTVHHGPPASLFRPSYEQGSYLAFLGRLRRQGAGGRNPDRPRRGHAAPHSGEGAAKRDGVLREASRVGDRRHAGPGEVDERRKQPFLSGAAALLFPIDWPEPFSLVIIEAMACGTPVIAYRAGSVPEVVDEGVTGLIVDNEAKAVRAVKELARIDRHKVRARFKERFTSDRMARPTRPTIGGFSSPSLPTYRSPTITSARLRLRSSRERRCSGG